MKQQMNHERIQDVEKMNGWHVLGSINWDDKRSWYANGYSTLLPVEIQLQANHSHPWCAQTKKWSTAHPRRNTFNEAGNGLLTDG